MNPIPFWPLFDSSKIRSFWEVLKFQQFWRSIRLLRVFFFHTFMPKYWILEVLYRDRSKKLINVKVWKLPIFKLKVHFLGQNKLKQTQYQSRYNDFGQSRRKVFIQLWMYDFAYSHRKFATSSIWLRQNNISQETKLVPTVQRK